MTQSHPIPSSLLAVETAGGQCGAALWVNGILLGSENIPSPHGHASHLAPLVERIVRASGFDLMQLGMMAAAIGPGGFTGIRAGLAFARGLALGAGCVGFGVDSFQRLMHSSIRSGHRLPGRVLVAIDSRRADLFAILMDDRLWPLSQPFLTDDPAASARAHGAQAILTDCDRGAQWDWEQSSLLVVQPTAEAVGELIATGEARFRLALAPQYLRAPEISAPKARRDARARSAPPEILEAGPAEIDVLAVLNQTIFQDTWHRAWSVEALRQSLAMPGAKAWISVEEGNPTGFVLITLVAGEAELMLIGVVPEARGKGHGRALLDRACREASRLGAERIHLEHAQDNAAARLYRQAGFTPVGLRPGYYRSGAESRDAILLAKALAGASGGESKK